MGASVPSTSFGGLRLPVPDLPRADALALLAGGSVEVLGRMPWSSNGTFLVLVEEAGVQLPAVYKPRRGERPLWDFPSGTLCRREVAAFVLSEALGWAIVPETVLRDGPAGEGAVQRFVDHDPDEHYFSLLDAHADDFRRFAVFDVLANNADRKGGHCLRSRGGGVRGIDHGLTFHPVPKLRTVIWDFAGERVADDVLDDVRRVCASVASPGGIGGALAPLLSAHEVDALAGRARDLLERPVLPAPDPADHCYPWPLV